MAAGQIYKGKNLRIAVDGATVFHATECSFATSMQLEEIATKDTQGSLVVAGNYTWSVSSSLLVADKAALSPQNDFKDILTKYKAGANVDVAFTTDVAGDFVITGTAILESFNLTAAVQGAATAEFSAKGSGDFEIDTVA